MLHLRMYLSLPGLGLVVSADASVSTVDTAGHEGWTIEGVIVCDNVGIIECVDGAGPTL